MNERDVRRDLARCPFCQAKRATVVQRLSGPARLSYAVRCAVCRSMGPETRSHDAALQGWNERAVGVVGSVLDRPEGAVVLQFPTPRSIPMEKPKKP